MTASISATPFHVVFDVDLPYTVTKTFRVFSSFPLNDEMTQGVIVAKDGTSFCVIGPKSTFPKKRKEVNIPVDGGELFFEATGFVMADQLDNAPHKVINEMFT